MSHIHINDICMSLTLDLDFQFNVFIYVEKKPNSIRNILNKQFVIFICGFLIYFTSKICNTCMLHRGYYKADYKIPDPSERHMHCNVIVMGRNDV